MRIMLFLVIFFSIGYALPSSAQNADWDKNIAFKLAVASHCAYKIEIGNDATKNKQKVKECLEERVRRTGTPALAVFSNLQDDAIETYVSSRRRNDQINAAFLVKINNGAIIAFRGTVATPQDWTNNLNLAHLNLTLYPNGRHQGFEDSLKALRTEITRGQIWQSISSVSNETLYITGHSKGGALAQGATVDFEIEDNFRGRIVPYIFGAARFFTAEGVERSLERSSWLNNLWRFEYQYDVVPQVPFGQITYDNLLRLETAYRRLAERALGLPQDWESKTRNNNFNFISVGKLAYVGDDNKLDTTQRFSNGDSYKNRLVAFIRKLDVWHPVDSANFIVGQHSNCYHKFLEIEVTNSDRVLSPNCDEDL